MTRQRSSLRWALGRVSLGLITAVAMMGLLAGVPASASPESDAEIAITDKWNSVGGVDSALGDKDGGVYAAGAGFVQNFRDGAIYFTPDTGARIMHGAILDRYRQLGGPDSDLGFPNIDEGPGRVSPESRNSTFSAADNPVIFWTPETGAQVVRGAMNAAWDRLGGSSGVLGVPTGDETYAGTVITQHFSNGVINYDLATGQFSTEPAELAGELGDLQIPGDVATAINTAYRMAGGAEGPLGARDGDPYAIGDDGTAQNFAGGKIYYTPATGAHALTGAVLQRYESSGGPTGELGFPTTGEVDGGVPDSKQATFAADEHPVIFWTEEHGAIVVNGPVKVAWDKLGGPTGALGIPIAEHEIDRDIMTQKFSGGEVTWNSADRTFTTKPDELAGSLEGIEVPNQPLPNLPALPQTEESGDGFSWNWLWWLVPLLALVGISLAVWNSNRRKSAAAVGGDAAGRRHDYDDADYDDRDYGDDHADYEDRGYLSGWGEAENIEPGDVVIHDELFTHRDALAEEDIAADLDEDQDAIDTGPLRFEYAAEDVEIFDETPSGRHAAVGVEEIEAESGYQQQDPLLPPLPDWGDKYGQFNDYPSESYSSEGYSSGGYPAESAHYRETAEYRREPGYEAEQVEEFESESQPAATGADESSFPAIHLPLEDPHEAPAGFSIKACMRSGTYHVPGGAAYDETIADIWFSDEEHAQANGFHRAD